MAERLTAIRRLVVGSQGFASRFRKGTPQDVEATIRRLSAVQLDSISAVGGRTTCAWRVVSFR